MSARARARNSTLHLASSDGWRASGAMPPLTSSEVERLCTPPAASSPTEPTYPPLPTAMRDHPSLTPPPPPPLSSTYDRRIGLTHYMPPMPVSAASLTEGAPLRTTTSANSSSSTTHTPVRSSSHRRITLRTKTHRRCKQRRGVASSNALLPTERHTCTVLAAPLHRMVVSRNGSAIVRLD
ncbi:hypothetical protein BC828DRAFT_418594 [Blastocladiella britannica]|nr:hypothetical protein BC828DRAFT_418594 [Blastocladiella britannica]